MLVGALAVLGLGGLVVWLWRRQRSQRASPWRPWSAIPAPRPLVTEGKQRDAVIAQPFSREAAAEGGEWDAVVVGSGMGGLSVAALLSRAAWRVLVLEQHDQAGGCCHSFVDKGFEFDVGIHYVGKVLGSSEFRAYLDQISDGQLTWAPLEADYDHVLLGPPGQHRVHPVFADRPTMRQALRQRFPLQHSAIDAFFARIDAASRESQKMAIPKFLPVWLSDLLITTGLVHRMTSFFRDSEVTMSAVLEELTDDVELRAVMSYCFGDFGSAPSEGPWTMLAMLWSHFKSGAGYPYGGSSQIAHSIVPVIEEGGGRVLVRAPVSRITLDSGGRVDGVVVSKGSSDIHIRSKIVISDAGVVNTFQHLLPPQVAAKSRYTQYIRKIGPGHAAIQLFVGLDGSGTELGLTARNFWCFPDADLDAVWRKHLSSGVEEALGSDPVPVLFVSFPSTKDPSWERRFPGRSVATVVSFGPWEWFRAWDGTRVGKRGEDYERLKAELCHALWERVLLYFPQLAGRDAYREFGSPLSTQHYLGARKGEIYGLDHGLARFTAQATSDLRAETDVAGLFLTGQDVVGAGFSGAAHGGLLAASALLRQNLFLQLSGLKHGHKPHPPPSQ